MQSTHQPPAGGIWLSWLPLPARLEAIAAVSLYVLLGLIALDFVGVPARIASSFTSSNHSQLADTQQAPKATPSGSRSAPRVLSAADRALALAAVGSALKDCAQKTELAPTGCPQLFSVSGSSGGVTWTLVGDPVTDAAAALTSPNTSADFVTVTGHYQMLLAYTDPTLNGVQHVALANGYRAQLRRSGQGFSLASLANASDLPAATRPPTATDAVIKDAVTQAFARCAVAQAFTVVDCPMRGSADSNLRNVAWKLIGDPLAQATVVFDSASGAFTVAGTYSMQVDYDATGLISFHHSDPSSGRFRTTVLWDGSAPAVAGIDRVS